jgi:hypothetical protein
LGFDDQKEGIPLDDDVGPGGVFLHRRVSEHYLVIEELAGRGNLAPCNSLSSL